MSTDSNTIPPATVTGHRSQRYHDQALRHKMQINLVLFIITMLCALAYFGWAIMHLNYQHWYVAAPYLVAETICVGSLIIWSVMMIHRREHGPTGLTLKGPPPAVDVVVTCCGEPLDIIEKTLRAAAAIDYPDYHVVVADDRNDAAVRDLCEELGFQHIHRDTNEHRKAGNLNYALSRTSNPFILTLDCDQVPHPKILSTLMGYFNVTHIGFVVTYQAFDVPAGDPWGNRDRVFYGAMQTAKNDSNSAISCGSGVVYRRTALDDIGGFSTWNLVEDLYSSLLLHNAGWKSVYHPFPLTHGTAPAEVTGHVRQRWQWAVDSMRILLWRNPLFTRGLSWRQRVNYLSFGYNYLVFGVAFPVFFLIPIWGLLSGKFMMDVNMVDFVLWRSPYLVAYMALNRGLTDHRHNSKSFRAQIGLFMVFFSAILTALFSRKHVPKYSVTRKAVEIPSLSRRLSHVLPHLLIMALCIVGIANGLLQPGNPSLPFWVNAVWAGWVVWLLWPFTKVALRTPPTSIPH